METNKNYEYLAKKLGISADEIRDLDLDRLDQLVEAKIGHNLSHTNAIGHFISRGNPLLALGRFINHTVLISRFNKTFQ